MNRNFPVDFVMPYVNNNEEVWRSNYIRFCQSKPEYVSRLNKVDTERYQDLGYLRYVFRGIDKYMPYIRNIFLIVSNIEQVPEWIDTSKVKIVLHEDIIPEEYLPTYNSTTIEMFLHNIEGLSQQFIYSNDDIYILDDLPLTDLFEENGRPKVALQKYCKLPTDSMYNQVCYRSFADLFPLTRDCAYKDSLYLKPNHCMHPMLKSHCEKVFKGLKTKILSSLSPFRTPLNYNQYLFINYAFIRGECFQSTIRFKYLRLENNVLEASTIVAGNEFQVMCLNDTAATDRRSWKENGFLLNNSFENKFKEKSKYEV